MSEFTKFPSIENFANVYKYQHKQRNPAVVQYGSKIKLHGTNAGVRIDGGEVVAQSRSRDLSVDDDNYGFAAWVASTAGEWADYGEPVTIYGEWGGNGIQSTDAVTKLDQKYFFVFAAQVGDKYVTTPIDLEDMLPDLDNLIVVPWLYVFDVTLDFNDPGQCQHCLESLHEVVEEIGERDPFIYEIFGIDGPGEGIVVSPVCNPGDDPLEGALDRDWYSALTFKVKTEAHSVQKTKKVSIQVEVPENVMAFVEMFATEARCKQGLEEACGGEALPENTGAFLKWMAKDILKESVEELAESGLEWKDVQKQVILSVRQWFIAQTRTIS